MIEAPINAQKEPFEQIGSSNSPDRLALHLSRLSRETEDQHVQGQYLRRDEGSKRVKVGPNPGGLVVKVLMAC